MKKTRKKKQSETQFVLTLPTNCENMVLTDVSEIKYSLEFNKILLKKQKGFQTKVYENKFNELIQTLNSYEFIIENYNELINEEVFYVKGLKDGKKKENKNG